LEASEVIFTPFLIVLVTQTPSFTVTSAVLDLLYSTSILSYYKVLFKRASKLMRLEFHISLMFDWLNLMP
jgi:hypothetical protein